VRLHYPAFLLCRPCHDQIRSNNSPYCTCCLPTCSGTVALPSSEPQTAWFPLACCGRGCCLFCCTGCRDEAKLHGSGCPRCGCLSSRCTHPDNPPLITPSELEFIVDRTLCICGRSPLLKCERCPLYRCLSCLIAHSAEHDLLETVPMRCIGGCSCPVTKTERRSCNFCSALVCPGCVFLHYSEADHPMWCGQGCPSRSHRPTSSCDECFQYFCSPGCRARMRSTPGACTTCGCTFLLYGGTCLVRSAAEVEECRNIKDAAPAAASEPVALVNTLAASEPVALVDTLAASEPVALVDTLAPVRHSQHETQRQAQQETASLPSDTPLQPSQCVVCLSATATHVALECGHLSTCTECTRVCYTRSPEEVAKPCVVCRSPVARTVKVYIT
jgi:hypothetical protein